MTQDQKETIDEMDYESMLRKWRFSPSGYYLFQGEVGDYYAKVMQEKRDKLSPEHQVEISKRVGW